MYAIEIRRLHIRDRDDLGFMQLKIWRAFIEEPGKHQGYVLLKVWRPCIRIRKDQRSKQTLKRSCIYKASLWNNEKGIFSLLEMFSKINGDIYMVLMKTGAKRGLVKTFKPFFSYPK
jgi:hypothetical protein